MINIILLFTLFSLHVGYIIPNSRIITRTSVLLNSIKKSSFNLENEYKNGLNLTNIRNEIKEEKFKTFNISAVREYIRYKLKERNETKNQ
uniref:Uncharacterized protein n=1 Tax=viral metagenome TaxID=1070528 RepID=A0A6C0AW17_9ZZZZ